MDINKNKLKVLIDKCEALTILCNKATSDWYKVKVALQLPLMITSSLMCVLNSYFRDNLELMKLPNVIVNGASVFFLAIQNSLKVPEKVELFKNLRHSFLTLAHTFENIVDNDEEITSNDIANYMDKYDNLVNQVLFEDISYRHKQFVADLFNEEGKPLPIQLNGGSGLTKKRKSGSFKVPNVAQLGNLEV
jgi:hypothetical protein